MKWTELLESWRHGASGARTVSRFAVHLPLEDAARLQALTEMFPGRSTEQIITDLLGVALQEIAAAMPYVAGSKVIANKARRMARNVACKIFRASISARSAQPMP